MRDKEKIIINGVDVSGCKEYDDGLCNFENNQSALCERNPDCCFKQLHRTKAQYNAVVEQNKSLQSEVLTLKNKNNILETELNQIKLLLEGKNTQYNTLRQECEELKEQVSRCSEGWGKASLEKDWYQQAEQAKQEENYNLEMELYRYKQALDEIDKFFDNFCDICPNKDKDDWDYCNEGCLLNDIAQPVLDIVNKAKEVNNDR